VDTAEEAVQRWRGFKGLREEERGSRHGPNNYFFRFGQLLSLFNYLQRLVAKLHFYFAQPGEHN